MNIEMKLIFRQIELKIISKKDQPEHRKIISSFDFVE